MKGNITRRGKNSWRIKFDLPPDADGKRKTVYETVRCAGIKEARVELAKRIAAVGQGAYVAPHRVTVADHVGNRIDAWQVSEYTAGRYRGMLRLYIAPHVGSTRLQDLTIADVETWHRKLLKSGLSAGTVRNAHAVLTRALRDAVRHGILARSVAGRDGETAPSYAPEEMKIIGSDQLDAVMVKLRDTKIRTEAMLALFCGLRAGEVLALRWDAVDLDAKLLHVRHTVLDIKRQAPTLKEPKTKAGRRSLTLPDVVVEALRHLRRRQLEDRVALGLGRPEPDALVFPSTIGGLRRPGVLSHDWRKAKVADVRFHDLRHTHVSMLIDAGLDLVTIAKRIGHKNAKVTLVTYAHLFRPTDSRAADAINAALGAKPVPKTG
ncbi:MAG: site-specific integrase [Enhydrobacter sp.]|nr:site-specific integrase [Enhydrobacter sp.]